MTNAGEPPEQPLKRMWPGRENVTEDEYQALYAEHQARHKGKPHYLRKQLIPGAITEWAMGGSIDCYLLECCCANRLPLSYGQPDDAGRFWEVTPHLPGDVCDCGGAIPRPGE